MNSETNLNTHSAPDVSRRGKWTKEEEVYAKQLIVYFDAGVLPIDGGTSLRNLLAQLLKCDPMRITKKFTGEYAIGKREFNPVAPSAENLVAIKAAQTHLMALRDEWLAKKTYGSRPKRKADDSFANEGEEGNRYSRQRLNDFRASSSSGAGGFGAQLPLPWSHDPNQQLASATDSNGMRVLLLQKSVHPIDYPYREYVSPSNVIGVSSRSHESYEQIEHAHNHSHPQHHHSHLQHNQHNHLQSSDLSQFSPFGFAATSAASSAASTVNASACSSGCGKPTTAKTSHLESRSGSSSSYEPHSLESSVKVTKTLTDKQRQQEEISMYYNIKMTGSSDGNNFARCQSTCTGTDSEQFRGAVSDDDSNRNGISISSISSSGGVTSSSSNRTKKVSKKKVVTSDSDNIVSSDSDTAIAMKSSSGDSCSDSEYTSVNTDNASITENNGGRASSPSTGKKKHSSNSKISEEEKKRLSPGSDNSDAISALLALNGFI